MTTLTLTKALGVLAKSSPFSVSTVTSRKKDELDELKAWLFVQQDIETDLRKLLASLQGQKIIFLCGSSGDGKSEILTRCISEYQDKFDFHLDATHSFAPHQSAIQALDEKFDEHKRGLKPLVLGINIGMLANYSNEGDTRHQEIKESPVMNLGETQGANIDTPQGNLSLEALKEDYSQYVPRGHYDKTEQLKAYFKSMMWYGRLTFRLKDDDEIKSSVLITLALNKENNQSSWNKIYEPINFFVGKSDDITYYQFKDLVNNVYGKDAALQTIAADKNKFMAFVELTNNLAAPQINSMPIFNSAVQPDRTKEIKGFRFMGQRFTIDASIFQRLITREVGPKGESCTNAPFSEGRMLPRGLDIPSAMGSKEAFNILKDQGETQYACYLENMLKMQSYISGLAKENWTQNLYWGWLYQLKPLTEEKLNGYPTFMLNTAWAEKDLNTYLGSWSELKHDTILYAKQTYAELGGGEPEKKDDRGYIEPNPYVYARLASLLKMTNQGLEERGLLSENLKTDLNKMTELTMSLKKISEKELNNENLNDAEYELIRSYGGQLEHFWLEINQNEPQYKELGQRDFLDQNPAAVIADVATDPNGQVLEEGIGKISEIYVVVPIEGKLRIAKGGVYSYYEFSWPLSDRLTDSKWREMLNADSAPQLPGWTNSFTAK